jgi:hypothetical protein
MSAEIPPPTPSPRGLAMWRPVTSVSFRTAATAGRMTIGMAYISSTLSTVFRVPRMEKSMFICANRSWFRRVAVAATALATVALCLGPLAQSATAQAYNPGYSSAPSQGYSGYSYPAATGPTQGYPGYSSPTPSWGGGGGWNPGWAGYPGWGGWNPAWGWPAAAWGWPGWGWGWGWPGVSVGWGWGGWWGGRGCWNCGFRGGFRGGFAHAGFHGGGFGGGFHGGGGGGGHR